MALGPTQPQSSGYGGGGSFSMGKV